MYIFFDVNIDDMEKIINERPKVIKSYQIFTEEYFILFFFVFLSLKPSGTAYYAIAIYELPKIHFPKNKDSNNVLNAMFFLSYILFLITSAGQAPLHVRFKSNRNV